MVGKTARELFSSAEAVRIEARDDELLQNGTALFDERELVTPAGGVRHISSRRLTIRDDSNEARYVLGVIDDVTERKAAEARIAQLAHYDPLTNLPNRTLFREQLETELTFVRRGAQLAVLYLDLDHFKSINDTLGHPAGDELLKAVAQRLRNCLRESDLIARLGGDEFAIVQTQLQDPKDAVVLALRLREAVTGASYDLSGHQTTTDLSIGIALSPGDGTEIDELVKHADLALYGAKAEGRANHRFFEPGMNARMKQRRGLEIDLRTALANDELELQYQPVINLKTGAIVCCEALLRWHHPVRGLIPPLEFIPVAEETGLINAIGDWALRRACVEAMNWPGDVSVAVNVSPVQFRNPALALSVVASLAASGLPARRLELEVTESVLMQNNSATLAMLHQIRDLGVRISMDDFGTGYSSLSYLRSFPFDKIKIDRSFIGDLSKGDDAVAIVHAILNLANSLKMTTTAEGVETADQQKLLQAAGCNEMQGYLFSPPRRAAEIAELFDPHRRQAVRR
jgi:diguanylate cyclase (GGDEF)-like protein